MTTGTLYIISSPSGGGKTSLVNALLQSVSSLEVSISHTTRPMRPGEQNHVDYHFVTEMEFLTLQKAGEFLEYAKVFGHHYGTGRTWVERKLEQGIDVVLEIDWQGARQIRQLIQDSISIFILPPSWEVLEKRLRERAQDEESVIQKRMKMAKDEIAHYNEYDFLVVNDNFAKALSDLQAILRGRRLREFVAKEELADLIAKLLI